MSKRIVYALPMPAAEGAVAGPAAPRFEKELIREGLWVHPTKKFTFRVTRERMRGWVAAFRRMREAGLQVPVPFGHSCDPRDNAGFLDDLRLDGNRLVGTLAVPRAEDAERIGTTIRDVSIGVNPNFVDAHGNRFGEVLEHVALTTRPLVEGQPNFAPVETIAAEGGDDTEVWTFSVERVSPSEMGTGTVSEKHETEPVPISDVPKPAAPGGGEDNSDVNAEHPTPNAERRTEDAPTTSADEDETASLRLELAREREARIEAEVARHVAAGRIPPAAADAARLLLSRGSDASDPSDPSERPSLADAVRQLFERLPAGAGVDLADRTRRLRPLPNPGNSALATGRAAAAAAKRMLESRGYAVTLSDDGATVLEAEKEVAERRA